MHDAVVGFTTRTIIGNSAGLVPWIVSLGVDGELRYALWAVGLVIELMTPYAALRPLDRAAQWHRELSARDRIRESYGMEPAHGGLLSATDLFHLDHIRERYGLFTFTVLAVEVPGSLDESGSSTSLYDLWLRVEPPAEATNPLDVTLQDEPDTVQTTGASYNGDDEVLEVFATSSFQPGAMLTVSVDGPDAGFAEQKEFTRTFFGTS